MALNAVATHSCTAVPDRRVTSAQHDVAVQPKEAATLAHFRSVPQKRAAARERPGATRSVQVKSHKTQGVSSAHLKAFQRRAASRKALNHKLGVATLTMQRSRGCNHSAHTVKLC